MRDDEYYYLYKWVSEEGLWEKQGEYGTEQDTIDAKNQITYGNERKIAEAPILKAVASNIPMPKRFYPPEVDPKDW